MSNDFQIHANSGEQVVYANVGLGLFIKDVINPGGGGLKKDELT